MRECFREPCSLRKCDVLLQFEMVHPAPCGLRPQGSLTDTRSIKLTFILAAVAASNRIGTQAVAAAQVPLVHEWSGSTSRIQDL